MMSQLDLKELLAKWKVLDSEYYEMIREVGPEEITITELPCSFFKNHQLFEISIPLTDLINLYVARGVDGKLFPLTENPDGFNEVFSREKISLQTEDQVLEFLEFFRMVTCNPFSRIISLNSVEDIPYNEPMDEEIKQSRAEILEKYRDVIKPPIIYKRGEGYVVTLFLLDRNMLQQWNCTVSYNGTIQCDISVLEEGVGHNWYGL